MNPIIRCGALSLLQPQCLVQSHCPNTRLGSPRPKSCVHLSSGYCPARSWVLAQEAEIPGIPILLPLGIVLLHPPLLPAPFSTNPQAPLPSGGQGPIVSEIFCLLGTAVVGLDGGCRRYETVALKEGFRGGLEQPGWGWGGRWWRRQGKRLLCEPRTQAVGDGRQHILGARFQSAGGLAYSGVK